MPVGNWSWATRSVPRPDPAAWASRPTMFGLEYSYNWLESMPDLARCIEFFNKISLDLPRPSHRTESQPAPL